MHRRAHCRGVGPRGLGATTVRPRGEPQPGRVGWGRQAAGGRGVGVWRPPGVAGRVGAPGSLCEGPGASGWRVAALAKKGTVSWCGRPARPARGCRGEPSDRVRKEKLVLGSGSPAACWCLSVTAAFTEAKQQVVNTWHVEGLLCGPQRSAVGAGGGQERQEEVWWS